MDKALPEEVDFLDKLDAADRERFFQMSEERKKKAIFENKLAHAEEKVRERDGELSQLTDRLASKSFQG